MPELPEVETVRRDLMKGLIGCSIVKIKVNNRSAFDKKKGMSLERLKGANVKSVDRVGKHLLLYFSSGLTLVAHLKMTGAFVFNSKEEKHAHAIFYLQGGKTLSFCDTRKFGFLHLLKTADVKNVLYLKKLGPDALEISRDDFQQRILTRKRQIKAALLDQTVLAGLGNIYVDEILYAAKIHPMTIAGDIPVKQISLMHKEMCAILKKSIQNRGTTISDYRGADGKSGNFQNLLRIYGEEKCSRCKSKIQRMVCGSRGTYFCPKCQRHD